MGVGVWEFTSICVHAQCANTLASCVQTMQGLQQQMDVYYEGLHVWLHAQCANTLASCAQTMQALLQQMDVYYAGLRVWLKARKEAKEAQDKAAKGVRG